MNNGVKAADTLKWFAWIACIVGIILFASHVSDFRAENFGLMAAIGFLIAAANIFILSVVFRLLHLEPGK